MIYCLSYLVKYVLLLENYLRQSNSKQINYFVYVLFCMYVYCALLMFLIFVRN